MNSGYFVVVGKGTFSLSGGDTSAVPAIVLEMETRAFCKSQHHMQLREAALPSPANDDKRYKAYITDYQALSKLFLGVLGKIAP
ncbi:hypothetical protein P5673_004102 [Acropora cervicornis]|uniref:Uncharacterized protein n=1 Tax=Acropora cervicornis TaxID=6130 RepID=A0AAD9R1P4_ACRCE|nr:hypothetical protein P5673_004102 [Acropora cervicornis]